ncbi:uncharacterized protein METZ01_LOCUS137495, partial [marine metagenome]
TSATPHTSPPLKRRFLKKIGGIAQFDSLENRSKVTRDPPLFHRTHCWTRQR